ncbi:Succinate dehydrogenase cytochrome B subunit [Ceratobasidium theobromae]|uniref:Succinate dehydrogenase cytochrome B subunit n=1 Tax=Ceratobasidium theobromae TaxID=1582974 RepID=A0A5N5QJJ7_9AGAM|nr:Succinate dehydrogenase cytochrome B subunit [Ceratobasidium theobromae]
MIASRAGLALRRQPLAASSHIAIPSDAIGPSSRPSLPSSAADDILNAQRIKRPSSPHFTIYQPQITWIGSIANRVTGGALSAVLYGFSLAYLAGPVIGVQIDSAHVVELVSALPEWFKYAVKGAVGMSFSYHSWNGIRHLIWDAGKMMTNRAVMQSGWIVVGVSVLSTIGLLAI